jgi:hypothetical protein
VTVLVDLISIIQILKQSSDGSFVSLLITLATPAFSHPLAISFCGTNYKEPVNGHFDDCTKDILKELEEESAEKKIARQTVEMKLLDFMEAIFVSSNTYFMQLLEFVNLLWSY